MKKIIFYLPALFLLLSCSQKDEEIYSCNPAVNLAIKENLSVAENLDRSEWLLLQEDFKVPVYRTFSEKKKLLFWKEKFQEIKKLKWSPEELRHIISAELFLYKYPEILSCATASDEILNKRDLFIQNWIEYAKNKLQWNNAIIISIVACGNKVVNTKGYIEIVKKGKYIHYNKHYTVLEEMSLEDGDTLAIDTINNNINPIDSTSIGEKFNCHCNVDNIIDFCPIGTVCDYHIISCESAETGCGWFFGDPCNGLCL